ncbi:Elongation factor 1-alpha [uncultured archaeon]|nr:Elongation factor 1-alpha [uncultured archaeon]
MGLNVCILGPKAAREEFCKSMGKKGSSDDFTFYNTSVQGKVIHLIEPTAYPEKLDAVMDVMPLCDHVFFIVDEVTPEFGEQVVLLDLCKPSGFIVSDLDLAPYIKGTALEAWKKVSPEEAKGMIQGELQPKKREGAPILFIDHSFEVKGVGSVLLGVVRQGDIRVHDKLTAYPLGKELEIRSIQKNDVDEKEASSSDRVGLSIKGLTSKDVKRGEVVSKEPLSVVSELPASVSYSKFAQKDSKLMHAFHCLQSSPCRIEGGKLAFEKSIALVKGEPLVLCDLNRKMRAVGTVAF